MKAHLVWSIYFLIPGLLCEDFVEVEGNCSRSMPPETLEVWGLQRDEALSCTMWGTDYCQDISKLPPQVSDGPFMGQPHSLKVDGTLVTSSDTKSLPQIIMEWTPPQTGAGFHELRGFLVNIRRLQGSVNASDFVCRVFDFSSTNFTSSDYQLNFRKHFIGFPGGNSILYNLEVYTLSLGGGSLSQARQFRLPSAQSTHPDGTPKNSADWVAAISYNFDNLQAPADVTIRFSGAPAIYGFEKYEIQLETKADSSNALKKCSVSVVASYECDGKFYEPAPASSTGIQHTFHGIGAGIYRIQIQAVDPHWQDITGTRCLCFQTTGTNQKICVRCMTTATQYFPIGEMETSPSSSSSSSSYSSLPTSTDHPDVIDAGNPEDNTQVLIAKN